MARDHKLRIGGLVALGLCAAAYATEAPVRPAQPASSPDPARDSWLGAALSCARECTPADEAASAKPTPADLEPLINSQRIVTIKGRLVPGIADCLLGSCCRGCTFEWVLAPRTDCPDWKLAVRRGREFFRRQAIGVECVAGNAGGAGMEVIVKGQLQEAGDKISATDLCRVRGDAAPPDAAPPAGPSASHQPPCPRPVPRRASDLRRPPPPPAPRSEAEQLNL